MLQDIAPHKFSNEYRPTTPRDEDYLLCFHNDMLLLKTDAPTPEIPRLKDVPSGLHLSQGGLEFLFALDVGACFLTYDLAETAHLKYYDAKTVFRTLAAWQPLAAATAYQLQGWYREHTYCGRCGQIMDKSREERALVCPGCRNIQYPKISPVVMVGIIDHDKLLLTKYAGRVYANYALIAGFVEIGETLEEAARREVMEEVGLSIGRPRYYKSQPWGISSSLLAGFFAPVIGSNVVRLDEKELAESCWFSRGELPAPLPPISLTQDMIEAFRRGDIDIN